ncbi:uncharacterized protein N7496_011441 [Penicillium cataractarum]|uniref:Uncharacterized protein n=1 Tax=Penicillium cataractarum TaxID=2100454 RepID=A0A9W9RF20_9EURO|nr:uncharacterized protein N7496_011441 [Penicillium cataractarum]KAJ5359028.1 hypothetical protein N7496_011441 [Penicillium cataractarum]
MQPAVRPNDARRCGRHRAAGFKPQVYRVVELAQGTVPSTEGKLASGSVSGTALRSVAHFCIGIGKELWLGLKWAPTRRGPQDSVNGKTPRLALSWKEVPFPSMDMEGFILGRWFFGRRSIIVRAEAELGRVTWAEGEMSR